MTNPYPGYVYVVDSLVLPGGAPLTGTTEPTWTSGPGLITDGNINWQPIADPETASTVLDGTDCLWQCLGAVPEYSRSGYIAPEGDLETTTNALTTLDTFTPPVNAATRYVVSVSAFDDTNGDAKFFDLEAFCYDNGGGPTFIGTPTSTVVAVSGAGAAAWTADLTPSGAYLFVNIMGENGKTIRWKSQLKMSETL